MGDVNFYNTKFDEMVFFVQPSWEVKERIPYFLFFRCNGDFGWKPKNNLNEINQVKVTLHFPAPSRNKTLKTIPITFVLQKLFICFKNMRCNDEWEHYK